MMTAVEGRYGVWLHDTRVGTLNKKGDFTWFRFSDDYLNDPERAVLGLTFEEDLYKVHSNSLRLPPWFSNLLPEGQLRDWIADDRGVSVDREMELLIQVGKDLPGAVRILAEDTTPETLAAELDQRVQENNPPAKQSAGWRFSLAGVGLKFSMLRDGGRLTMPAYGQGGDWIVKLPDQTYRDVPRNENAMMTLARAAGINVPDHMLVHRNDIGELPEGVWQSNEEFAYAVKRFDRADGRKLIHIEDFAQVRNIYPYFQGKYQGSFETVAALSYRGRDLQALQEFARRLAFNVLISNGDAHLKNWSLIYYDRRVPTLSPVYDLVSTAFYRAGEEPEDLGLKFNNSRRFDRVTMRSFGRLEEKLGTGRARLRECVADTVERTVTAWPSVAPLLSGNDSLQESVDASINKYRHSLLRD